MAANSLTCPMCGARMKLPAGSEVPSKACCVKCKTVFATGGEVDDEPDPSAKSSARRGSKGKKSRKKTEQSNLGLWIAGGIGIAAIAVVVVVALQMTGARTKPNSTDLTTNVGSDSSTGLPAPPPSNNTSPEAAPTAASPTAASSPAASPTPPAVNSPAAQTPPNFQATPGQKIVLNRGPELTPEMKELEQRGFKFNTFKPDSKPLVNAELTQFHAANSTRFTDDDFDWLLEHFPNVSSLGLTNTKITDAGAVKLANFKQLTYLDIDFTAISDKTVEALSFPELRHLGLSATKITDRSLKHIAKNFPELEWLSIEGTASGDAGLKSMTAVPFEKLKMFILGKTRISGGAITAFEKAHPNCNCNR